MTLCNGIITTDNEKDKIITQYLENGVILKTEGSGLFRLSDLEQKLVTACEKTERLKIYHIIKKKNLLILLYKKEGLTLFIQKNSVCYVLNLNNNLLSGYSTVLP